MRFERQLEKKLAKATDPEEVAQLEADLHIAQVDVDYAMYYPFMEPYVGLYAGVTSGDKEKDEKATTAQYLHSPRPPMWEVIEKTREEGRAALQRLQNRPPKKKAAVPSGAQQQPAKQHGLSKQKLPPPKEARKGISSQRAKMLARSQPGRVEEETSGASDNDESSDSEGGGFFEED